MRPIIAALFQRFTPIRKPCVMVVPQPSRQVIRQLVGVNGLLGNGTEARLVQRPF